MNMNCKVCGKTSTKNPGIAFFRFPSDPKRCEDWAKKTNILDAYMKYGANRFHKSYRICSEHFKEHSILFDGKKRKLTHDAVPEIFMTDQMENTLQGKDFPKAEIEYDTIFKLRMIEHLCRVCAEENRNLTRIYGHRGKLLDLEKKMRFLPIQITINDVLPLKICNSCISKIDMCHNLIINCTKAEEKLKIILGLEDSDTTYSVLDASKEQAYSETFNVHDLVNDSDENYFLTKQNIEGITEKLLNCIQKTDSFCVVNNQKELSSLPSGCDSVQCNLNETNCSLHTSFINKLCQSIEEEDGDNGIETVEEQILSSKIDFPDVTCSDTILEIQTETVSCEDILRKSNQILETDRIQSTPVLLYHLANDSNGADTEIQKEVNEEFKIYSDNEPDLVTSVENSNERENMLNDMNSVSGVTNNENINKVSCNDYINSFDVVTVNTQFKHIRDHDYVKMVENWFSQSSKMKTENDNSLIYDKLLKKSLHSCTVCLKNFQTEEILSGHKKAHLLQPNKDGKFVCDVCHKLFYNRYRLNEHIRIHSGETPYKCSHCDKSFHKFGLLKQHQIIHNPSKPYACSLCNVRCNRKGNLEKHMKIHWKGIGFDKSIIPDCEICSDNFDTFFSLVDYNSSHQIDDNTDTPSNPQLLTSSTETTNSNLKRKCSVVKQKKHECQYCGKVFTYPESKIIHERIHTGELPHQCKICRKRFRSRPSLNQHADVHSDTRKFSCKKCPKRFKRNDALKNHLRIHTGERPFCCTVCGFAFKQRGDCLKHEKNHKKLDQPVRMPQI